ncbi:MAG: glycoside hydrolase family 32 protein [Nitriliruptoraceae bacterium]
MVHLTPPSGWMNDPNGLVHHDGTWHAFYQHEPEALVWGPMHWGHAVSRDLLTWEHRPIALVPDGLGQIFSGSAVVDHDGSAGCGAGALLAFFTYHRDGDRGQGLAWSRDGGLTWTKHPDNPVLPAPGDGPDFRDPRVLRYEDDRGASWWVMVVAAGAVLRFYRSDDLLAWTPTSTLAGLPGADGGVVETPELLELELALPEAGLPGGERSDTEAPGPVAPGRRTARQRAWVLVIGVNAGGPNGGSGARYLVGHFDGERFSPTDADTEVRWVDHGADLYALQAWSGVPDGRRIWVGWMSNWAYANEVPATTWRGMLSIPREVRLVRDDAGLPVLSQRPVRELDGGRTTLVELHGAELAAARAAIADVDGPCLDVRLLLEFPPAATGELALRVHAHREVDPAGGASAPSGTRVSYDPVTRQVVLDRSRSGTEVAPGFPTVHRSTPLPARDRLDLRILTDTCSVEVFAADGTVVLSDLVLPAPDATGIRIDRLPVGARILHLDVGRLAGGGAR